MGESHGLGGAECTGHAASWRNRSTIPRSTEVTLAAVGVTNVIGETGGSHSVRM